MKINAIKLINELGGSTVLYRRLVKCGNKLSKRTVDTWKHRRFLNMNGLMMIQDLIKKEKLTIDIERFYEK